MTHTRSNTRSGGRQRASASLLAASLLAVAVGLAGCTGVPTDAQPEPISSASLPDQLLPSSTSTTSPTEASDEVLIYLVRGEPNSEQQLIALRAKVPSAAPGELAESVLTFLVENEPTAEHMADGLRSDIPEQVRVGDVVVDGTTATVDISGLEAVESTKQRLAVAQIVFTLTQLEGIDDVVILLDGQGKSLSTDIGSAAPGERLSPARHFPDLLGRLNPSGETTTTTVVVQTTTVVTPLP